MCVSSLFFFCELARLQSFSMGVSDLLKQDKMCSDKWKADYISVISAFNDVDLESCQNLLCPATYVAIFYSNAQNRINSDLSYMNTMLQKLLTLCFMAHNMNTPGAYGMTLRIGDLACSVNVLKEDGKSNRTSLWIYDPKHPGMGIDQCTGNLAQQCNAEMIHMSLTKEQQFASLSNENNMVRTLSSVCRLTHWDPGSPSSRVPAFLLAWSKINLLRLADASGARW